MRTARRFGRPAALAMAVGLVACGGVVSTPTAPIGENDPDARLISLTDLDQRVAAVAYRLSDANADLCPTVRQSAGWALHAANQYSLELRPFAESRFHLTGDLPGVLAAPEGSPAQMAGFRQGDVITAVNDEALPVGTVGRPPAYDGLAANVALIDRALSTGPTRLTIRRDGADETLTLTPRQACGYEVQLNPSDELNARADGRRLFISTALAGFTQSDDELALILGHELAHHVLGHREWSDVGGLGRASRQTPEINRDPVGGAERQADRTGLYLMARAGYDPNVGPAFWNRYGAYNWQARFPQVLHASASARGRAAAETAAEIAAKRTAGEPLLP